MSCCTEGQDQEIKMTCWSRIPTSPGPCWEPCRQEECLGGGEDYQGPFLGGDLNQWGPEPVGTNLVGTHPGTILGALAGGLLGYVPSPPMDC